VTALRRRASDVAAAALAAAGLAGAAVPVAAAAPAPAPAFACDRDSTLTLFGLDTASGTALLAAPPARDGEPPWWIELPAGGESAAYRPAGGDRPFAGSIGPGPVFAVRRCGAGCLQPVRWEDGGWRPLGEPLAGDGGTVHATYDRSGTPWVVLHRPIAGDGAVEAHAFRLAAGGSWRDRGARRAVGAGTVAAVPDPSSSEGVLSGSARFTAGGPPETWVAGLPALPPERRGELLPGGVTRGVPAAVYLDAGGRFYLSEDGGESWRRSDWAPWGETRARLWQPGRDYSVDLPSGDRRPPLAVAWFDRRQPGAERLHLTSWSPGRGWAETAALPPATTTLDGALFTWDHLLRPAQDSWLLLTGCVNTAAGPGLAVRTTGPGGLSKPRFVPLLPAGP
jgi:hypothetical protein